VRSCPEILTLPTHPHRHLWTVLQHRPRRNPKYYFRFRRGLFNCDHVFSFYISDRLVAVALSVYLLRYGLDDPGFKSRHRRGTLLHIVRTGCRTNPAFISMGAVFFQVVKWRGYDVHLFSPSSTRSKNGWS
jgi:hypothetical protein